MNSLVDILCKDVTDYSKKAIIQGQDSITYEQLQQYSQNLAEILSENGMEKQDKVVIMLRKSILSIVSMFGILKMKGTYIPIDYELPLDRIRYIIENSGAKFVITDSKKRYDICGQAIDITILTIEDYKLNEVEIHKCYENINLKNSNMISNKVEDDVAYIIYTSGSTGVPKGVEISNRSVINFIKSVDKLKLYDSDTRFLNVCPLYFDASVLDIFVTLYVKGTIILMDKFIWPVQVLNMLHKYDITDTLIVPSVINMLVNRGEKLDRSKFKSLKTIWFGGETCSVKAIRSLMKQLKDVKFIHGYGPTESTHSATINILKNPPCDLDTGIPIGKPLSTVELYVVSEDGKEVEVGEHGELYIGGEQLMNGYCNNKELTDKVLIDNYINGKGKLYKSGDIVFIDNDGNYNFVSRKDNMVKVGGNLVYMSEIEEVIMQDEKIDNCFVLPLIGDNGTKLVSAIIKRKETDITEQEIRQLILSKLPNYMIPSIIKFISQDDVKLTPAGKIDKNHILRIINM